MMNVAEEFYDKVYSVIPDPNNQRIDTLTNEAESEHDPDKYGKILMNSAEKFLPFGDFEAFTTIDFVPNLLSIKTKDDSLIDMLIKRYISSEDRYLSQLCLCLIARLESESTDLARNIDRLALFFSDKEYRWYKFIHQ